MRIVTIDELRELDEQRITSRDVEEALRQIAIACGGRSFTDWVRIVKILGSGSKRMSDDLIYDLKRDNTLPETFDTPKRRDRALTLPAGDAPCQKATNQKQKRPLTNQGGVHGRQSD
jgi:hypothetical protein